MSNFVTRTNTQLLLNGSPFRFSGCNAFFLGLVEAEPPGSGVLRYPTTFECNDVLATAVEMGASVVRSHTLGISVGTSLSVWPSLNTTNSAAFAPIDYAIYRAGQLGLKLIIPLTDNFHYYHGGKHTFTDWRSISDETQFYTNATVIADFKAYINVLLTHVNQYNGLAYKDDPTILAWETGNELLTPAPPSSWTSSIATYIKSIDGNHLVGDGTNGTVNLTSGSLALSKVDLYTDHAYPPDLSQVSASVALVGGANKAYFVGEFDWRFVPVPAGVLSIDSTAMPPGGGSTAGRVDEIAAGQYPYYVQLAQSGFTLTTGTSYTLSFYAKASLVRPIDVVIQGALTPFTQYFSQLGVSLGGGWQSYSYSFTMAGATDHDAQLSLNVAASVGTVWFVGMNLATTIGGGGGGNLLQNPSFASGSTSPWQMILHAPDASNMSGYLSTLSTSSPQVSGDLFWSLLPHNDAYGWTYHSDGFSVYYPDILSSTTSGQLQLLRSHAYTMKGQGNPVPQAGQVGAPTITSVVVPTTLPTTGTAVVAWQGVAGGTTYSVQRSVDGAAGPYNILVTGQTDFSAPWTDPTPLMSGTTVWYQVQAQNYTGSPGPWSAPFQYPPGGAILPPLPPPMSGHLFGIGTWQPITGGTVYGLGFASQAFQLLPAGSGTYGGTYGFVLDTTIRAPTSVVYTPAQSIGLDGVGVPIVRGYPTLAWTYNELRPDYWYYLLNVYYQSGRTSPQDQFLCLLQFPDPLQNGASVLMSARMNPPTHTSRDVGAYYGVQLTFSYVGQTQISPGTPVTILS